MNTSSRFHQILLLVPCPIEKIDRNLFDERTFGTVKKANNSVYVCFGQQGRTVFPKLPTKFYKALAPVNTRVGYEVCLCLS